MIEAKIIADSYNDDCETRITTFELIYPRFVHSELMTHRMFSRNAASSRAIPIDKVMELVMTEPAIPVHWGANQSGMQAKAEVADKEYALKMWLEARDNALQQAHNLKAAGLHKQLVNRVLEPFQLIKVIVTATDFNNWFWLRNHEDAQPEIHELAQKMLDAYENSFAMELLEGEWHVPYVTTHRNPITGELYYIDEKDQYISSDEACMISASCCAQVSYRKNDASLEKAEVIFDRLINSQPVHASPVEHVATPIVDFNFSNWEEGITHVDRDGYPYSGNLCGWIQLRQLIANNVMKG